VIEIKEKALDWQADYGIIKMPSKGGDPIMAKFTKLVEATAKLINAIARLLKQL